MIQLSALSATSAENPGKAAVLTVAGGCFERLLSEGTDAGTEPGGKILPASGKELPDGLPAIEVMRLAGRRITGTLFEKAGRTEDETPALADDPDGSGPVVSAEGDDAQPDPDVADERAVPGTMPPVSLDAGDPAPAEIGPDPDSKPARTARNAWFQNRPEAARLATRAQPDTARGADRVGRTPPATLTAVPGPVPVLDPLTTTKGGKPADAPQPARIAPGGQAEPIGEIKLQLSNEAGAHTRDGAAQRRAGAEPATPAASATQSAQPTPAEPVAASGDAAPAKAESLGSGPVRPEPQAVRPQDLSTLVDRLVEARESARGGNASLTVMHAEFGRVSMHFAHDNGNLTVSLANNDPGFARAVNAAVPADGSMNADTQPQGDRRGDGAQTLAGRPSEHGGASERGAQPRADRNARDEIAGNPSDPSPRAARKGARGIFA